MQAAQKLEQKGEFTGVLLGHPAASLLTKERNTTKVDIVKAAKRYGKLKPKLTTSRHYVPHAILSVAPSYVHELLVTIAHAEIPVVWTQVRKLMKSATPMQTIYIALQGLHFSCHLFWMLWKSPQTKHTYLPSMSSHLAFLLL